MEQHALHKYKGGKRSQYEFGVTGPCRLIKNIMIQKDAGFAFIIIAEKKVRPRGNNQEQGNKSGHVSSVFLKKQVFKNC